MYALRFDPQGNMSKNRFQLETINGRRWVREVRLRRSYPGLRDLPPGYQENFYTPVDQHRLLEVTVNVNMPWDYDVPSEMPGWMKKLSAGVTTILRSIKLSPPDDGSPDPFLVDPEQKLPRTLVEFPAKPTH